MTTATRRRAAAAHRMPEGDPWRVSHDDSNPTPRQLQAWCEAANHIVGDGLTPLLPLSVVRAMWRAGGPARVLAVRVRDAGGAVAPRAGGDTQ